MSTRFLERSANTSGASSSGGKAAGVAGKRLAYIELAAVGLVVALERRPGGRLVAA
jgi:hypothetical protein